MTPEQITKLNKMVHERVMEATWDETRCRICGWTLDVPQLPREHGQSVGPSCLPGNCSMRPAPQYHADAIPEYAGDITWAWSVVDRLHVKGFWMKLQSPFEKDDSTWNAGFTQHSFTGWNGRPDHRGQADNAPLAICLAAIAAVESVNGELHPTQEPA